MNSGFLHTAFYSKEGRESDTGDEVGIISATLLRSFKLALAFRRPSLYRPATHLPTNVR